MQIKSTVRYHLSPLRLATVRKTKTETENNKCYQGQGKLEPLCAIGGNVTVPPNIKNRIYIWCNDSTSEYKPRTESRVFMRELHTLFISALLIIAKRWKPPKCPRTDEQISKAWYIHTVGYYSANPVMCYSIKELWGHYPRWNKPVTNRQVLPWLNEAPSHQIHKYRK